jgi:hypothetical protein
LIRIYIKYGNFHNDVRLNGKDLRIDNYASEKYVAGHWSGTGDGWVKNYREVSFNQKVYMQGSSSNWDGAKSTQSFTGMGHGKFIAQNVQVHPTSGTPEV